jgi:ankyrin repeat protein
VNALLAAGADVRKASRNGNGALHAASAAGHAALVVRLLAARAPLDGVNVRGDTPLHLAVRARCLACARSLVTAGASTSVRNANGLSAPDAARLSGEPALMALFER